jgi:tRNA(Leu) C34 or U34 (ribose-2'-O)-methylase TrmL
VEVHVTGVVAQEVEAEQPVRRTGSDTAVEDVPISGCESSGLDPEVPQYGDQVDSHGSSLPKHRSMNTGNTAACASYHTQWMGNRDAL